MDNNIKSNGVVVIDDPKANYFLSLPEGSITTMVTKSHNTLRRLHRLAHSYNERNAHLQGRVLCVRSRGQNKLYVIKE